MTRKRVAILISGRGSNMAALIEAAKAADYPAEIALVLSNVPDAAGLARAREAGIATEVIDHKPFGKDREAFDRQLQMRRSKRIASSIVCLAGFMRAAQPLVRAALERADDQHPSLAVAGLQGPPYRMSAPSRLERKSTVRRCTSSCRRLDSGPIIEQASVPVLPGDTPEHACRPRARGGAPHLSPRAQARRRKRPSELRANKNPRPRGRGLRVLMPELAPAGRLRRP